MVLLHGLGSSRRVWEPVTPALDERFDVIAVDLPGFGDSPPLPADVEPTPAALAASVAAVLDELDIAVPHVVGNSLGGWVALELAAIRPVCSLALLSPAGLWRDRTPLYDRVSLRASRWFAVHAGGLLSRLVERSVVRTIVLGQTHGRPSRMTADEARTALRAMGSCPGFDATLQATANRHYQAEEAVHAPVTVAFGTRDHLLLRRQSRHVEQLPAGTRVAELPGCGHVPMYDNPGAVVDVITASVAQDGFVMRNG